MSTITSITQAVYFTLRKNLGRESNKPKTPSTSTFFKKLRTQQDKYNKYVCPNKKIVLKSLGKIYTQALNSVHKPKTEKLAKDKKTNVNHNISCAESIKVVFEDDIVDMPVITGKCSGFRIPVKSMKSYEIPICESVSETIVYECESSEYFTLIEE